MRKQFVSDILPGLAECCSRRKLSVLFSVVFLAGIIVFSGCTDITEFDAAFNGQLHIIFAGDLSTVNTVSGISGARSLLIYPGNIFIASTEGVVHRYDSETLAFVGEYQVDSPSPAGFFQMAMDQSAGIAYLIGANGKIVKFSLPDCIVQDVFGVCQSPVALAIAPGNPSYLYVGDGPTNTINQVSTSSNMALASHDLEYPIKSIAVGLFADSIIVGTSRSTFLVEELGVGNLRVIDGAASGCSSIDDIPNDTIYVVTAGNSVGVLRFYKDPAPGDPSAEFLGEVEIEGISHFVAAGNDWQHSYVLSYIGDNTSRLTSYNHAFFRIDQQVEIPGFPLDLKVSGSNVIYALTYE
ncbi:MAG: hypothetical protein KAS73_04435 [Candidatus Sabulitectum sp.]|nr:hypothetical protein [Candidatus Sabulitectum sp.]